MYRVTGFVAGEGEIEKLVVASSADEAARFFKTEVGKGRKLSVTVVSIVMEEEANKARQDLEDEDV